jgi:WD40 repeat protein
LVGFLSGKAVKLDLNKNANLFEFTQHIGIVSSMKQINKEMLATGSNDFTIILWNMTNGSKICTLQGQEILPNGNLISAGCDSALREWNIPLTKEVKSLTGHMGCVNVLKLNSTMNVILSGSADNTIRIWNMDSLTYTYN